VESPPPPVAPVIAPVVTPPPAAAPTAAAPAQSPAEAVAAAPSQVADAPRYAGDGFQSPQLADRNCISENLRLPSQLGGAIPDMVTARVAVSTAGQATTVQVMGQVADPRISDAVRRAVQACSWIPGADAQGKPTALWVVLPIRLTR
jgi:protein TonB